MPADKSENLKAKFKEALEKKQGSNDSSAVGKPHGRESKGQHQPHGPENGKRGFIRRKTG